MIEDMYYVANYPFIPEIILLLHKRHHFVFFKQWNSYNNVNNKLRVLKISLYYISKESLFYNEYELSKQSYSLQGDDMELQMGP